MSNAYRRLSLLTDKMVFAFIDFIGKMPFHQLVVVTLVGVGSGIYIFRPLLERYANEHGLKNRQEEHSSNTDAATAVDEVKSSTPEQKKEDTQRKENAGNASGN